RPGVTSTIIGARTLEQLEQNLGALAVKLTAEQAAKLTALSAPKLNFPAAMVANGGTFMYGGLTVNGDSAKGSPWVPKADSKIW
ncbi:MAG: aldo/keto reductase, partial [Deltaproteobacteria bacterium]|nr:aldo/keto reductase [Deltaproteobacteria bacterium]